MGHAGRMTEADRPRRRVARRRAGPPAVAGSEPEDVRAGRPSQVPTGAVPGPIPPDPDLGRGRRRQRARVSGSDLPGDAEAVANAITDEPDPMHSGSPADAPRTRPESGGDRALRALVSTRSTQLSPTAAMRAREVSTPTAEDLAAAERDLVIVRRHYQPPTPLTAGRRRRPPSVPE